MKGEDDISLYLITYVVTEEAILDVILVQYESYAFRGRVHDLE
jgi:hypothetical protein